MKRRLFTILSAAHSDLKRLSFAEVNAILALIVAPSVGFGYWLMADWQAYVVATGEPKFEMPQFWQFFESSVFSPRDDC